MLSKTAGLMVCLLLRLDLSLSGVRFEERNCILTETIANPCVLDANNNVFNYSKAIQVAVIRNPNSTDPNEQILQGLFTYEGVLDTRDNCTKQDFKLSRAESCTEAASTIAAVAVTVFILGCLVGCLGTVVFSKYISPMLNRLCKSTTDGNKLQACNSCEIVEVAARRGESRKSRSPSMNSNEAYGTVPSS
jgi:hypothetical protein